jgi:hypothetical protein
VIVAEETVMIGYMDDVAIGAKVSEEKMVISDSVVPITCVAVLATIADIETPTLFK